MTFSHPDYTILKALGHGASASVYLAVQKKLNRRVALKVIRHAWASEELRQRFQREAIILAKLNHPNIVPVYELHELDDGERYLLVMQYIDGGTLRARAHSLAAGECLDIMTQITDALAYVHDKGFLHRDIKPENVLFDGDRAMLVDFGIARAVDSQTRMTLGGAALGTPAYMSPEQVSGETLDPRSDLYSLGITFYEMLTGSLPFHSESAFATGVMQVTAAPPPLPAGLACFQSSIDALLAKAPRQRPANATALLSQLRYLRDNLPLPHDQALNSFRGDDPAPLRFATGTQPERRQLTVMTCEMAAFSELSRRLDPEQLLEVAQAFRTVCEGVIDRYGGQIARYSEGGVMVYFGRPVAHEDDAVRALHAAMDIPAALASLNTETGNRAPGVDFASCIGIDTGSVVMGDSAGLHEHDRLVVGQAPTIAAQIQAIAAPNTTVVTAATWRLARGRFFFQRLDNAHPVDLVLYKVLGPNQSQTRFSATQRSPASALFGRQDEFAWLEEQWSRTQLQGGRAAMVYGDAGIGKSCLVNELLTQTRADDCRHIVYQCSPYHRDSSLYPALQHLANTAELTPDASSAEKIARLGAELNLDQDTLDVALTVLGPLMGLTATAGGSDQYTPARRRELMLRIMVDYIFRCARNHALVFVIEDLHWVDPTTLELVRMLLGSIEAHRVLCVLTARPHFNADFPEQPEVRAITLQRLRDNSIEDIVSSAAHPRALPDDVVKRIVAKSDGVPLFAEELTLNLLESTPDICSTGQATDIKALESQDWDIPSSLRDILAARLDRMGPAKKIMQAAACIGRDFNVSLLEKISPVTGEELEYGLQQLVQAGLIYRRVASPTSEYSFKHALVRDAAYDSSLSARRTGIHAAVLAELRHDPHTSSEVLAHHATRAGQFAAAMGYWDQAGGNAIERAAFEEAVEHYEHAIACARMLPDVEQSLSHQLYLLVRQGHASTAVNGFAHPVTVKSNAAARALLDQVGETPHRYSVFYGHWVISHAKGEHEAAAKDARQMFDDAERCGTREQLMMAHRLSGISRTMMGLFAQALDDFEQFDGLYDPVADATLATRYGTDPMISVRTYRALALLCCGETNKAVACLENLDVDANALGHQHTVVYALAHLALIHQVARSPEREKYIALANEIVDKNDLSAYRGHTLGTRAMYLFELEEFEQSRDEMMRALPVIERTKTGIYTPLLYACHSANLAALGRESESADAAETALAMAQHGKEHWALAEIHRLIASAHQRLSGVSPSIVDELQRGLAIAEESGAHLWALRTNVSLARTLLQLHRHTDARRVLVTAMANFPSSGQLSADYADANAVLAGFS